VVIDCAGRPLVVSQPVVMGVLNVTPDSFSDGGQFTSTARALDRGLEMAAEGAAIIDIGGESTRPGAAPVSVQQELDRVLPVIEQLLTRLDIPVSIDTRHFEVMVAAISAGVGMVNDVNALRAPGALEAVSASNVAVCLMHMQANPQTMQDSPVYDDPVAEIRQFLLGRVQACQSAGIKPDRLVIDPGFGFGKTLTHNLQLLAGLDDFASIGVPLMVGVSRKSMFGTLLGRAPDQRLPGSLAATTIALERGAKIIRCHDVAETVDAIKVWSAMTAQLSEIN